MWRFLGRVANLDECRGELWETADTREAAPVVENRAKQLHESKKADRR